MFEIDHLDRRAMIELLLIGLIRDYPADDDNAPDTVEAMLDACGLSITFSRDGFPLAGEGA